MASGDRQEAKNIQEQVVHRLGNLTISGFNSALGNKSFSDKQNREKDGRPVGYKNGLWLNQELAQTEAWSVAQIEARTQKLVDETMKRFQMNPGQV